MSAGPYEIAQGRSVGAWPSTQDLVSSLPLAESASPIFCHYPEALRQQAHHIMETLPSPFYAVKANTSTLTLECLVAAGIRQFDVASMVELLAALKACPDAACAYMTPVKQTADIAKAYRLGVRTFALDSLAELEKIRLATQSSRDCTLVVRLALAPKQSVYDMTGKFGAPAAEAVELLQRIATQGNAVGLTFHVGSQCEHPQSFAEAIDEAGAVAEVASVRLDVLDVGGGFPAYYKGNEPKLALFGQTIRSAFNKRQTAFGARCQLQTEPGRAMVAGSGSVLVRVELRRGQCLFLNEGLHGLLSELRWMPRYHPVRRIRRSEASGTADASALGDFSLAGPTCDSGDFMKGPYALPGDMQAGDWIEIGFLGAYCVELVTPFNGFGQYDMAVIDGPTLWASPVD